MTSVFGHPALLGTPQSQRFSPKLAARRAKPDRRYKPPRHYDAVETEAFGFRPPGSLVRGYPYSGRADRNARIPAGGGWRWASARATFTVDSATLLAMVIKRRGRPFGRSSKELKMKMRIIAPLAMAATAAAIGFAPIASAVTTEPIGSTVVQSPGNAQITATPGASAMQAGQLQQAFGGGFGYPYGYGYRGGLAFHHGGHGGHR